MPANADDSPITRADLKAVLASFAEAIIGNISDLRNEMNSRFDQVDRRFTAVEQRLDRVENLTYTLTLQNVGMGKSIGDGQRLISEMTASEAAMQRALDELKQRVAAIERKQQGQQ